MSPEERAAKIKEYRERAESDRRHANFCPSVEWSAWCQSADEWERLADALERESPRT